MFVRQKAMQPSLMPPHWSYLQRFLSLTLRLHPSRSNIANDHAAKAWILSRSRMSRTSAQKKSREQVTPPTASIVSLSR